MVGTSFFFPENTKRGADHYFGQQTVAETRETITTRLDKHFYWRVLPVDLFNAAVSSPDHKMSNGSISA